MATPLLGKGLGCHRSLTLRHTPTWTPEADTLATLPARVDLRTSPGTLPIGDQGQLGSCTAWAATRMAHYVYVKEGYHNPFVPSALFQYYTERQIQGSTDQDSGATIAVALDALMRYGQCAEHWWPYDIAQYTVRPPLPVYQNATRHLGHTQVVLQQDITHLKACLAAGYPFDMGFVVYGSFEAVGPDGQVPMPGPSETPLGGHSVCGWGYDDNQPCAGQVGAFLVPNQWGTGWGDQGWCWMPYAYLTDPNLAFDFHSLRAIS